MARRVVESFPSNRKTSWLRWEIILALALLPAGCSASGLNPSAIARICLLERKTILTAALAFAMRITCHSLDTSTVCPISRCAQGEMKVKAMDQSPISLSWKVHLISEFAGRVDSPGPRLTEEESSRKRLPRSSRLDSARTMIPAFCDCSNKLFEKVAQPLACLAARSEANYSVFSSRVSVSVDLTLFLLSARLRLLFAPSLVSPSGPAAA
jgi:hypothetical protein